MKKRRIYFILLFIIIFYIITGCSNSKSGTKDIGNGIEEQMDSDTNVVDKGDRKQTEESNQEEFPGIPTTVADIKPYWPTVGWQETTPESVGMDSALLADMFKQIEKDNIPMEGFIVIKDGYIVAEKYSGKYDKDLVHPIYSITKSLSSGLVGVAIKQGAISSVNDKVINYLEEGKLTNINDWKKDLSIKNFLTMKSGIDFPEQTQKGFYNSDTWKEFMEGEDPAYYIFNRPVSEHPDAWNYSTGDARVVSKVVQEATGVKLSDFAKQNLFEPLGISNVEWPSDRSGTSFGGTGIMMKPRDIAKIGYLYLNNGKWGGQQILPKGWVQESTQPYADTNHNFDGGKYGYFLWLKPINGFDTFRGMGLYGQYMVVIPELNLVVVQTSSGMDVDPLLEKYIIPSIKN